MKKLLYVFAFVFLYMNVSAVNYYVKSGGNDEADGLSDETAWGTLLKVETFQASLVPGDSIFFKRGDTFHGSIVLNKSGIEGFPIVYGAYGSGEKPVITGLEILSEWTNEGDGIYSKSVFCGVSPYYIVMNNQWYPMGRYPNEDWVIYEGGTASTITDNELTGDPDWTGAEVVIKKTTKSVDRCLISTHTDQTLTFTNLGSTATPLANYGYFLQNDMRTLDEFGEWYYDGDVMFVYFGAENPDDYTVGVPTIERLIYNFRISWIVIENLQFIGAGRKGVYLYSSAVDNIVQDCNFNFFGEDALTCAAQVQRVIVRNNVINHSGRCGIYTDGNSGALYENNVIKNSGTVPGIYPSSTFAYGVYHNYGDNSTFQNNYIDSTGNNGIWFSGINPVMKNNVITHTLALVPEGAGIYAYAQAHVGRVIEENIVMDVIGNISGTPLSTASSADGIYLNSVVDATVIYNTVANIPGHGLRFRNLRNSNIGGNVVYNSKNAITFYDEGSLTYDDYMYENIFVAKSEDQNTLRVMFDFTSTFVNAYTNYYARPVNDDSTMMIYMDGALTKAKIADWQAKSGEDSDAMGSPVEVEDESMLRFYYTTNEEKVVELDKPMIDMDGNSVTDEITLYPWTSIVLLVDPVYVGIKDTKSERSLVVYPNPASSQVWIKVPEINNTRVNYSIMDIQGKVLIKGYVESVDDGIFSVNTSSLLSGIYLVRVEGQDGKSYNERLVIRR